MADPNHPRKFTEEFRRQIVQLYLAGKSRGELMAEYDLGSSTLSRWIKCYGEAGVTGAGAGGHAGGGREPERREHELPPGGGHPLLGVARRYPRQPARAAAAVGQPLAGSAAAQPLARGLAADALTCIVFSDTHARGPIL